jgi:hypothetical protein
VVVDLDRRSRGVRSRVHPPCGAARSQAASDRETDQRRDLVGLIATVEVGRVRFLEVDRGQIRVGQVIVASEDHLESFFARLVGSGGQGDEQLIGAEFRRAREPGIGVKGELRPGWEHLIG